MCRKPIREQKTEARSLRRYLSEKAEGIEILSVERDSDRDHKTFSICLLTKIPGYVKVSVSLV